MRRERRPSGYKQVKQVLDPRGGRQSTVRSQPEVVERALDWRNLFSRLVCQEARSLTEMVNLDRI